MNQKVYEFIINEQTNYQTVKIPVTSSYEWNMSDHIERCTNVANGWYHSGKNDGLRRYDDIVTPIINVAVRTEGFDVKDIVPYVNSINESYKSFLIKKFHPKWARKNELDTFIDDIVESSVIYDLVLVKNVNNVRPEVVPLQKIAFCDQTDILGGPLCLKHQYSTADILEYSDKWNKEAIDEAIVMSETEKVVMQANNRSAKTPGKYIEVYELYGNLPESWLDESGDPTKYVNQMHIVCFYTSKDGNKNGITLFKGKTKKIDNYFKSLVIKKIHGRATGKSIVETLFEPQVWMNYSAQRIQKLLASAINVFHTDSEELGNQKLSNLPENTILKHEAGKTLGKVDGTPQNLTAFTNDQVNLQTQARILGSASEGQLGVNPTSGTPFALQNLIVQQGQGIHEYRQGKIATFVADVLYRDWILKYLVDEMNNGVKFSEELSLDEMQEVVEAIARNKAENEIVERILKLEDVTDTDRETLIANYKEQFNRNGSRGFFEVVKGELNEIPLDVFINIKGKQKNMSQDADKITNVIREVLRNPQAFQQVPGMAKAFNQLLENSGMSPIDFSKMVTAPKQINPSPAAPPEMATAGSETITQ
jgi:hypothetical protein